MVSAEVLSRECGSVLAAKFVAVIDVDVARAESRRGSTRARDQDQFIVEQHSARKALRGRRQVAERQVDESGLEPAIHLAAFARPQGERNFGPVTPKMIQEALSDTPPKVEFQAHVARAFETFRKRHLVAGLAPQLRHHLGIAFEFEAGRGELRSRLAAMEQLLADFLLQRIQPRGHGRLGHVEPARGGDQAFRFDHLQERAQRLEVHGSILSNLLAKFI